MLVAGGAGTARLVPDGADGVDEALALGIGDDADDRPVDLQVAARQVELGVEFLITVGKLIRP